MMALWLGCVAAAGVLEDGARAVEAGNLDEAVQVWSAVSEEGGRTSGVLAYNLGTVQLRRGELPQAIAHLRAAARLRPRDGAIHHNLALSRAELGLVPPPAPLPSAWMSVVTPGELGLLGLLGTLLGSLLLVIGSRSAVGRIRGSAVGVLGLAVGVVAIVGGARLEHQPIAVILGEQGDDAVLRDAASVNAGVRLRLPAGTEVQVQRDYAGFFLVEDGRGRRGWLAQSAAARGW